MFLLFIGKQYYPSGGINDLHGIFDSPYNAKLALEAHIMSELKEGYYSDKSDWLNYNWAHIYDLNKQEKIYSIGTTTT